MFEEQRFKYLFLSVDDRKIKNNNRRVCYVSQ
ncbi:hypothetical protein ETECTG_CDS0284 [Escherichia phage ETEC-TG]|nr:hypothetical protein ETECTG_CDS0284 [Escherichia phage ETEC-TG]